ncbi:MAG: amidohydrolase family protein [Chitinophagaceae bacterium]
MQQITDTHIHIWDLQRADYLWLRDNTTVLNRTWTLAELEPERTAAGITGGVLVQAANNFEDTDLMLETAGTTEWIRGVVGWLPLTDPGAAQQALNGKYGRHPYFKGVRHLIHDEPDPRWLMQPAVLESLSLLPHHGLTYDVVGVLPEHIETVLELAERIPGLRMVLDHLNQPPLAAGKNFGRWGELMKAAAQHDNLHVKLSGLGTASGKGAAWQADDIKPCTAFVLELFGADRCFCGGDWPVSLLAGSYEHTWQVYRQVLKELVKEEEREKILYSNAGRFYSL